MFAYVKDLSPGVSQPFSIVETSKIFSILSDYRRQKFDPISFDSRNRYGIVKGEEPNEMLVRHRVLILGDSVEEIEAKLAEGGPRSVRIPKRLSIDPTSLPLKGFKLVEEGEEASIKTKNPRLKKPAKNSKKVRKDISVANSEEPVESGQKKKKAQITKDSSAKIAKGLKRPKIDMDEQGEDPIDSDHEGSDGQSASVANPGEPVVSIQKKKKAQSKKDSLAKIVKGLKRPKIGMDEQGEDPIDSDHEGSDGQPGMQNQSGSNKPTAHKNILDDVANSDSDFSDSVSKIVGYAHPDKAIYALYDHYRKRCMELEEQLQDKESIEWISTMLRKIQDDLSDIKVMLSKKAEQ